MNGTYRLLSACSSLALMAGVPVLAGSALAQTNTTTVVESSSSSSSSSTATCISTSTDTTSTDTTTSTSTSVSSTSTSSATCSTTTTQAQSDPANPALQINPTTGVPSSSPSNFEGSSGNGVTDPGIRESAAGAGGPIPNLQSDVLNFFFQSHTRFQEVDSVNGSVDDVDGSELPTPISGAGLGPSFNGNSCAQCHVFPAVGGGSSPITNPQVSLATLNGATNTVPPFIMDGGPIREARFPLTNVGTPDGGVHDLYVITGRTDATNQPNANTGTNTTCTVAQTNFPQQIAANNIIFRIPISIFGDGLVENIGELQLQAAAAADAQQASGLGITTGRFNPSGNDGTIMRFGWKAQNKSLMVFAGEAYNVEQGVSNDLMPDERSEQFQDGFQNDSDASITNCFFNPTPEDTENFEDPNPTNSPSADFGSDITGFSGFMRLSAAPTPAPGTASTNAGLITFENIGCGVCHTPTFTTNSSAFTNNNTNATFSPFSDFALHDMGTVLADHVSQGAADGNDYRSSPLFGVGQRAFFLHDGRTSNIVTAIEDHASQGSEANEVVLKFNLLPPQQQQNIVNFLRSL
jgi:CxxC motif-containing protein (DUF1111 family)